MKGSPVTPQVSTPIASSNSGSVVDNSDTSVGSNYMQNNVQNDKNGGTGNATATAHVQVFNLLNEQAMMHFTYSMVAALSILVAIIAFVGWAIASYRIKKRNNSRNRATTPNTTTNLSDSRDQRGEEAHSIYVRDAPPSYVDVHDVSTAKESATGMHPQTTFGPPTSFAAPITAPSAPYQWRVPQKLAPTVYSTQEYATAMERRNPSKSKGMRRASTSHYYPSTAEDVVDC